MKMHHPTKQFERNHHRRGVALMLVMIAILVTGGMAVAYFGSRDNSIAISANVVSASKARVVAESGLDLAVAILETNAQWRTSHIDGVILQDYQLGAGSISISVIDSETGLPPTESTLQVIISITSTVDGRTQITEATATIIPNDDEFDVDYSEFAMFAANQITMLGTSSVQHWSSSPQSSQDPVSIGTLARNPMAVQIDQLQRSDNLKLHTAKNASSMISTTLLNSTEFSDYLPFLNPPTPPSNPTRLSISSLDSNLNSMSRWASQFTSRYSNKKRSHNVTSVSITEGSYILEDLHITSNSPLEIRGDVSITVANDMRMEHANITLIEDATLTLHLGGEVEIYSSYIGNKDQSTHSWMDPSRIKMYGQSGNQWDISGSSMIKAELYAPSSAVDISGISTICGRIAAHDISLRGASRVLYDQSLDHGGFANTSSMLYEEDGSLVQEVRQLTQLNQQLLDSIELAISDVPHNSDAFAMRDYSFFDWRHEPTLRPNEVIYMIVVYGVDTRTWEVAASTSSQYDHRNKNKRGDDGDWYDIDTNDDDWYESRASAIHDVDFGHNR